MACMSTPAPTPDVGPFPKRVLITNDNGIADRKIVELARAFAAVRGTEVYVVAANRDRSGATNFLGATREGEYRVERRNLGAGIEAWALDGYPADCVIFGFAGPLRDRLPDLVVSGINGGPNLGDDWFGSGTIGAARTASYFGVPGIAISGLEGAPLREIQAASQWVVRFAASPLVRSLTPPEYLTISFPAGGPSGAKGVRIAERARGLIRATATPIPGTTERDSLRTWRLQIETSPERASQSSDVGAVGAGFIAIVPMHVDEYDVRLAERLRKLRLP